VRIDLAVTPIRTAQTATCSSASLSFHMRRAACRRWCSRRRRRGPTREDNLISNPNDYATNADMALVALKMLLLCVYGEHTISNFSFSRETDIHSFFGADLQRRQRQDLTVALAGEHQMPTAVGLDMQWVPLV
jgi:hypothetical protein